LGELLYCILVSFSGILVTCKSGGVLTKGNKFAEDYLIRTDT